MDQSKETLIAAISAVVHYEGARRPKGLDLPALLLAGAIDKMGNSTALGKMADYMSLVR